jgi:hypothetical protein
MAQIAFARSLTDAPEQERPGDLWQTTELWVNERLVERGLEAAIRAVLAGERTTVTFLRW